MDLESSKVINEVVSGKKIVGLGQPSILT